MPSPLLLLVLAMQGGAGGAPQEWVPPQPPCDVKAGHFRVTSAIVDLQNAASKPNARERLLKDANDVLTRAITQDKQDKNAGAWYYLGRYYVEVKDAPGADTAFQRAVALAPQCKDDIDRHSEQLWVDVINHGLSSWQESKLDSAKLFLRQAAALRPSHPRAFLALGQIYESENKVDSASAYLSQAAAAAGSDTAFAALKKDALAASARLNIRRLQGDPAVQRWQRTRFTRDSLQRQLTVDSTVLSRIEASSASRRARGARLAPADQQAFSRDSTARAKAVADRRAALAAMAGPVATDSAAAAPLFDPAIKAYRAYLGAYPEATDAVTGLATLYIQSGRVAEASAAFDAIYPPDRKTDPAVIIEAGEGAMRANAFAAGTRLLERAVAQRPYDRDALTSLANGYQALRDSTHLLPMAQRLQAIDPLSRTTLRLVAAGWDLRGRRDSAQKYRDLAETGLQVEITISDFRADSTGYVLEGVASNAGGTASPIQRLTFEFLDATGHVQVTQSMDVPQLPPQGSQPIQLRVSGTTLVAWRYRPS